MRTDLDVHNELMVAMAQLKRTDKYKHPRKHAACEQTIMVLEWMIKDKTPPPSHCIAFNNWEEELN